MGFHHALGCAAQPLRRLLFVLLDPYSFDQADGQIIGTDEIAPMPSLPEPFCNAAQVLRSASTSQYEIGQVHLRSLIARLGRDAQPTRRLLTIVRDAGTG